MGEDAPSGNADERLAWNLRMLREQAGISQAALAADMTRRGHPWHQSTVYRVESGKQTVRFGEAADLADILGVPVGRLMWTSPAAVVTDFIDHIGQELRQSATAVADAVADLLAVTAKAERALSVHEASPYERVQEARAEVAKRLDLYNPDGAVAEGKRRYEERAREGGEHDDGGPDAERQPGVVDQQ